VASLTAEQWQSVLAQISHEISPGSFQTWFGKIELISLDDDEVKLGVPNLFMKEWIREHYLDAVLSALETVTGTRPAVNISISPRLFQATRQEQAREVTTATPAPAATAGRRAGFRSGPGSWGLRLNREFTLESFVVGPSNRLAFDTARAVSESPSASYNPLFLHGGPGLGKTHLLQGICHRLQELRPGTSVLYLSCEEFTNAYITALQGGKLNDFRNRCRGADYLIIDDVHFLAAKEHTQEEFFHTFDALHNLGKQVVLSSDAHPKEIAALSEKLKTRFVGGLVAELETPVYETRLAIVRAKAAKRGLEVPEQVAELIAKRIEGSVRELEGAVATLTAASRLTGRPLDMTQARAALRRLAALREGPLGLDDILKAVEKRFGVPAAELRSATRARRVLVPRQVAMYIARRLTDMSLSEIGRFFGGRDHATVLYAERKIEGVLPKDEKLAEAVEELTSELQG
jgi:chromosomal replication initiator protein